MSDFYTNRTLKSRKVHLCDECETPIEKGTLYIKSVVCYDDSFNKEKAHVECREFYWSINKKLFHQDTDSYCCLKEHIAQDGKDYVLKEAPAVVRQRFGVA